MSRRWPRTLFARLMLIWLVGLALVLSVSFALFLGERDRHDNDVFFEGLARETASAIDVLNRLSPPEREQWLDALGRRRLRISLQLPPRDTRPLPEHSGLVQTFQRVLPERPVRMLVQTHRRDEGWQGGRLFAVVELSDGQPVTVRLPQPPSPPPGFERPTPPGRILASLSALVLGILLLTWFAVRLATRPLSRLAEAARALGEDPNRAALPIRGPIEVTQAATAFNQMQQRIQKHVSERTRILAAISHDLQTPVTRLRLRAEQIDDDALRTRVQSDLDAMQALIREGLDYARSLQNTAPLQVIDIDHLIEALCEDAHDMGWQVQASGRLGRAGLGHATGLRRALWNLIENGVKFGQRVHIELQPQAGVLQLLIRDEGPGLSDAELEKVFEPFYRTEASRNRETGGTGLGLAIARNLLRAQGGDVRLDNAPQGGLQATVTLPAA